MKKHRETLPGELAPVRAAQWVLIFLLLFVLLPFCGGDSPPKPKPEVKPASKPASVTAKGTDDLTGHPVYSRYVFDEADEVVDFGTQPLAIPTGTLAEVLKRDLILKRELAGKGVSLRFYSFFNGADLNFFLRRGDLDMGVAGDMPVLKAAAEMDVIIPAMIKQNFTSIVAKENVLLEDLKGKRIGIAYGSTAHYSLLKALAAVDLSERDITLVPLKVNKMGDALAKGKIDAFSAWEPHPTIALARYNDFKIIQRNLSTSYFYMSRRFMAKKPQVARCIVAALIRALRWMAENGRHADLAADWSLAAATRFTGKKSTLSRDQMARLINEGIVNIASSPIIPQKILAKDGPLEQEFYFLKKLNKISSDVSWENAVKNFDRELVMELLRNSRPCNLEQQDYQKE